MNWKTWVPLVLAIVLGLVAAKAAHDVMMKSKNLAANAKFAKVVVTRGDVHPGMALTAADLALAQIDAANVPATSFGAIDKVVGRVSETLMIKGQPVVEAMLAPTGSGSGLQALVPPGMRAITIEVNESSGIAGLISPGCRVDVIATLNDPQRSGGEGRMAKTIVQNVKVTAVGQRTSGGVDSAASPQEMSKTVTILATLEDAEALELASAMGRPRLVLRGGRDNELMTTVGVSMNDLKGTGGRPDTGTSAIAVATPTTMPTMPLVVVPTPPTTRPVQNIAQADAAQRRIVRVVRGGRVSLIALTAHMESPEVPEASGEQNVAGGDSTKPAAESAVGSISDPFDAP